MRSFPMILAAGLLSAGLLAGSGPAHAAMPTLALDRSAVADKLVEEAGYYYRRRYYRPYRPALRLLWLWAALALLRQAKPRDTDLNSRVESKPVATSAKSLSATGSARWLRGARLASDCAGCVSSNVCKDLMGHAETDVRFWHFADHEGPGSIRGLKRQFALKALDKA
jgi:hypothetical protein